MAYGDSQARGRIGAVAAGLYNRDLSHICDLHCSSRQHWILNPLSEARCQTHILMDASGVCYCWTTMGTSMFAFKPTIILSLLCLIHMFVACLFPLSHPLVISVDFRLYCVWCNSHLLCEVGVVLFFLLCLCVLCLSSLTMCLFFWNRDCSHWCYCHCGNSVCRLYFPCFWSGKQIAFCHNWALVRYVHEVLKYYLPSPTSIFFCYLLILRFWACI